MTTGNGVQLIRIASNCRTECSTGSVEPSSYATTINPFQSNFSATRILPSSYLFWAGKRLVDYLSLSYILKREKHKQKEYNLRYLLAKVRATRGKASGTGKS
jgi:hypothetical protein